MTPVMSAIRTARRSCVAVALGLLAGCASEPVRHFTLQGVGTPSREAAAPFIFELLPVGVPLRVDRPQMLLRQPDGSVVVMEGLRWASPVSDELQAALSVALAARLGTRDAGGLAVPAQTPLLRVAVQVRRFDSVPGVHALLEADWSAGFAGENARLVCHLQQIESAAGGVAEVVAAHQRAVDALAARIAEGARAWAVSRDAECPGG